MIVLDWIAEQERQVTPDTIEAAVEDAIEDSGLVESAGVDEETLADHLADAVATRLRGPSGSIPVDSSVVADEAFVDAVADAVRQGLMEDGEVVPVEIVETEE